MWQKKRESQENHDSRELHLPNRHLSLHICRSFHRSLAAVSDACAFVWHRLRPATGSDCAVLSLLGLFLSCSTSTVFLPLHLSLYGLNETFHTKSSVPHLQP